MTTVATLASLFSGGEGVGIGGKSAGLQHIWGIEINNDIAQVARDNGFDVTTADILDADPADYETPTVLHASPPCPNFSAAKQGRRETARDISMAQAAARFIKELRPQFFTCENVYGYRKSESWHIIADTLNRCGYWYDLAHVNAANFGVPQTRKRMIVRAALGQMVPQLPPPEPWIGWYKAVEDLLPTLPESQFAPWQLARLELHSTTLVDSAGYPDASGVTVPVTRHASEPANTIIANHASREMKAFLIGNQNAGQEWSNGVRRDHEPSMVISTKQVPRAFLVGGQFAAPANGSGEPRPVQAREQSRSAFTVTAVNKGDWRAWLTQGRIVQMTPRALARFQSFPDWYLLPKNKTLACRVIGLAVPPLLFQKLITHLLYKDTEKLKNKEI